MKRILSNFLPFFLLPFILFFFLLYGETVFFHNKSIQNKEIVYIDNTSSFYLSSKNLNEWIGLIGKDSDFINNNFGEPTDIQKSLYGYDWWIYPFGNDKYIQFGIKNNKVQTIYAIDSNKEKSFLNIGENRNDLEKIYPFQSSITLKTSKKIYDVELDKKEFNQKPFIYLNGVFVQLYFDTFTNQLSSVRFLSKNSFLNEKPYIFKINGKTVLPTYSFNNWGEVEKANELQIFYVTNILRNRFDIAPVKWSSALSELAYSHSKDMNDERYFDHDSPKYGTLSDRLLHSHITFNFAGENIATNYTDGPSAVEGWLNSYSHRHALLNPKYNDLGVGVFHKIYTQDFIFSP